MRAVELDARREHVLVRRRALRAADDERSNYRWPSEALLDPLGAGATSRRCTGSRASWARRRAPADYERDAAGRRTAAVRPGAARDRARRPHALRCFPIRHAVRARAAGGRRAGGGTRAVRAARVVTLPALAVARPRRVPRLRRVEGRCGREGVRPRRGARSARPRLDAPALAEEITVLLDPAAAAKAMSSVDRRRPRRHQGRGRAAAQTASSESRCIKPTELLERRRADRSARSRSSGASAAAGSTRSGSGSPRSSSSRPDALCLRSTFRSWTCRFARCSRRGSACPCSSTTTQPSRRSPRRTTSSCGSSLAIS